MKIVVIHSAGVGSDFIVSTIDRLYKNVTIIEEKQRSLETIKRIFKRKNGSFLKRINRLAFCVFYILFIMTKIKQKAADIFGPNKKRRSDLIVSDINSHHTIESAFACKPDLIFIVRTSLLKGKWLDIKTPIINVHYGITPSYRGSFCWFWPILNNELNKIGATFHLAEKKADTGKVLLKVFLSKREIKNYGPAEIILHITKKCASAIPTVMDKAMKRQFESETDGNPAAMYYEPTLFDYYKFIALLKNRMP